MPPKKNPPLQLQSEPVVNAQVLSDTPIATGAPAPAAGPPKRGRPPGSGKGGNKNNTKNVNDVPLIEPRPKPKPKAKSNQDPAAQAPLVPAEGAPPVAAPVQKRHRRTKVQMEAARAAEEAEKATRAQQQQQAQIMLVQKREQQALLEHMAEVAHQRELANTMLYLSDVEDEETFQPPMIQHDLDLGEHFNFEEVDAGEFSDEKEDEPVKTKKKGSKSAKGETRASVDIIKQKLREDNGGSGEGFGTLTITPTQPTPNNGKAVGLPADWQTIVDAQVVQQRVNLMGGWTDEDVFSSRPSPKEMTLANDNSMVSVAAAPGVPTRKAKGKKTRKVTQVSQQMATVPAANFTIPIWAPLPASLPAPVPSLPQPAPDRETLDVKVVPRWVDAKWDDAVLPSLYHLLWVSEVPFTGFTKGSELLAHVHRVMDAVFPGHTLAIDLDHPITQKAYARLNEKRSLLGQITMDIVETHFANMVPNDPATVAAYCKWATPHGPALFRVPVSRDHPNEDDPLYTPPQDIFESPFIIRAMTVILKSMQKSVLKDLGYPKGALALVATGIERGFIAHDTGVFIHPGEFSHSKLFEIVDQYLDNIKKLSDRRWESILKQCQVQQAFKDSRHQPLRAAEEMNKHRRNLYVPSPVKGTGQA
ncbi:hypothetical protein K435DRAFT_857150 [Dendrothele bispora CBS 962.96]|uniref:Uncharacterized protein n=1 Tax=Dendrothele bispora (strain CBS 962.96) TaxID=1314807 RepID=A0A4S8M6K5_DENBC|nr:hypothetical protein K435DRAFT_857150 [Dendrothele bispora CBS 962.96]